MDELWAVARASNATIFKHHIKLIEGMGARAYNYIDDVNPTSLSRLAFSS
jgi:hypothetical protein